MVIVTLIPQSRPLTAADLESMPNDGHRYELIDGTLIVTPSPAVPHQRIVGNLYMMLRTGVAAHLEVMLAPLDITVSDLTVLQPDLLVAGRDTLTGRKMLGLPVLAVEVLSPSTRLIDLNLKKAAFERAGVESYWVVDPDRPAITVWQLMDGAYVEVSTVEGHETLHVEAPFALAVTPSDLVL